MQRRQQERPPWTFCLSKPEDCLEDRVSEMGKTLPSSSLGTSGIVIDSFCFSEILGTAQKAANHSQTDLQQRGCPPARQPTPPRPPTPLLPRSVASTGQAHPLTPERLQPLTISARSITQSNTTVLAPHLGFRRRTGMGVINRKERRGGNGWKTTS